jgi:hypothetical protein
VHPAQTVVINVGDEWVEGDLLLWLRSDRHGWYGYVHWTRNHWINTQPVPADRIRVVLRRSVNVYDDGDWRPGTLYGWRRYRERGWEAAVVLRGMGDSPRWLPATRVRPV